jgi:hypothetical protein
MSTGEALWRIFKWCAGTVVVVFALAVVAYW